MFSWQIWVRFCAIFLPWLMISWPAWGLSEQGYVIKTGDTLYNIALQLTGNGQNWQQIYQKNRSMIPDIRRLQIGQVILIPDFRKTSQPTRADLKKQKSCHYHQIQRGDTYFRLAQRYLGHGELWPRIYQVNRIHPYHLPIGKGLCIPTKSTLNHSKYPQAYSVKPTPRQSSQIKPQPIHSPKPLTAPSQPPTNSPLPSSSPGSSNIPSPVSSPTSIPSMIPLPIESTVPTPLPPPSELPSPTHLKGIYNHQLMLFFQPSFYNETLTHPGMPINVTGQVANGMGFEGLFRLSQSWLLEGGYDYNRNVMERKRTLEQTERTRHQANLSISYVQPIWVNPRSPKDELEAKIGIGSQLNVYQGNTAPSDARVLRKSDYLDENFQTAGVVIKAGVGYKNSHTASPITVKLSADYSPYIAVFQNQEKPLDLPNQLQSLGVGISAETHVLNEQLTLGVHYHYQHVLGSGFSQNTHELRFGIGHVF